MRKAILFTLLLFPSQIFAQSSPKSYPAYEMVQGNIQMPSLLKLQVQSAGAPQFVFSQFDDFSKPKEMLNFFQLKVKATQPWIVTCQAIDEYMTPATAGSANLPSSLISLKKSTDNNYVPLSTTPQSLAQSLSNSVTTDLTLDIKMNPPMNYRGDQYYFGIIFSLTQQ